MLGGITEVKWNPEPVGAMSSHEKAPGGSPCPLPVVVAGLSGEVPAVDEVLLSGEGDPEVLWSRGRVAAAVLISAERG